MFRNFGERIRRFLSGRYGSDQLNRVLLIAGAVLLLLGWLGSRFLSPCFEIGTFLAYVPLVWGLIRMYSRDFAKRRRENEAFLRLQMRLKDRDHRYFRCPNCRQTVRVPRKKGKINICCPKCQHRFIRKT